MNKRLKERLLIYKKFNGHCAYCGRDITIKEMQIDHQVPLCTEKIVQNLFGEDLVREENLFPACRRCNHYKRAATLEEYRMLLKTLHKRLSNDYRVRVAIDYNIIKFKPFDGIFYFEKQ